jgi:hypothetical protein
MKEELIKTIDRHGITTHRLNGIIHRTDGPAVEKPNGDRYWYVNGEYHRTDGPAIEYADGEKRWYINGNHYEEEEYNNKIKEQK